MATHDLAVLELYQLQVKHTQYLAALACRGLAADPHVLRTICDHLALAQQQLIPALTDLAIGTPKGGIA